MSNHMLDLFSNAPVSSSLFIYTGKRNLAKILDIGLISPELVACDSQGKIKLFPEESLAEISAIDGAAKIPVLLEVDADLGALNSSVFPVESVLAIHFCSEQDKEDYLSRAYENVPTDLYKINVRPDLFAREVNSASENSELITLSKIDNEALFTRYRPIDVFAGVLWEYLCQSQDANKVKAQLSKLGLATEKADLTATEKEVLISLALDIPVEPEAAAILGVYFNQIAKYDVAEGWVAKQILSDMKDELTAAGEASPLFEKWHEVTLAILNNERELTPLDDDQSIVLRAILLHLLNPDIDALNRMADRQNPPGEKVMNLAKSLAAGRLGFAAMQAKYKQESSGAYFLVSTLATNDINKVHTPLKGLTVEPKEVGFTLSWHGKKVGDYLENGHQYPKHEPSSSAESNQINESDLESDTGNLALTNIVELLVQVDGISKVSNAEGTLLIEHDKKKHKLLKHVEFSMSQVDNEYYLQTRLLDFNIASHIKKLTGPKMRSALEYQTKQGLDFKFDLLQEDRFQASIRLDPENIDRERLQSAFQRLIDAQEWMKQK